LYTERLYYDYAALEPFPKPERVPKPEQVPKPEPFPAEIR
jgi:hypothetical protein